MFARKKKPGNRAALMEAFREMTEKIIAHEHDRFDHVMSEAILPFADTAGMDRLGVYRLVDTGRDVRFEQMYYWDREYSGTSKVKDFLNAVPVNRSTERWHKVMEKDGVINMRRRDMIDYEKDVVGPFGILSLMMVPVFYKQGLWGVVTYQEHTYDRLFEDSAVDILRAGARVCADAVMKNDIIHVSEGGLNTLKQSKRLADALARAAHVFLENRERGFSHETARAVEIMMDTCGFDKMSLWRNFPMGDGLHTGQIYRWDKEHGGQVGALQGLHDIYYQGIIPTWETRLRKGVAINGPAFEMPESEVLRSYGCLSLFASPVTLGGLFWGFVLFEDMHLKRHVDKQSADALTQMGLLLGNMVLRSEAEREMAGINDFNRRLLDAMPLGFIVFDEYGNVIDCNQNIINMFGCDKPYLASHFYEMNPQRQPNGAASRDTANAYILHAAANGHAIFEWVYKSLRGETIPAFVTLVCVKYKGRALVLSFCQDLRQAGVTASGGFGMGAPPPPAYTAAPVPEPAPVGGGVYDAPQPSEPEPLPEPAPVGGGVYDAPQPPEPEPLPEPEPVYEPEPEPLYAGGETPPLQPTYEPTPEPEPLPIPEPILLYEPEPVGGGVYDVPQPSEPEPEPEPMPEPEPTYEPAPIYEPEPLPVFEVEPLPEPIGGGVYDAPQTYEPLPEPDDDFDFEDDDLDDDEHSNPPPPPAVAASALPPVDLPDSFLEGKTILLAEDIEINREIVLSLLEDLSLTLDMAENGKQALDMVQNEPDRYDAVLMDVQMPIMNGLEATKRIRAFIFEHRRKALPIIAMTANVFQEDIDECTQAGMDYHIAKPVDRPELIDMLKRAIYDSN